MRTLIACTVVLSMVAVPLTGADTQVPCGGEGPALAACPDLAVDPRTLEVTSLAWEEFAPEHCAVVEGMVATGERRLLRFPFTTPNVGAADLVIGPPAAHPEWFEWSGCHQHHHFRQYADYRLWTLDGYALWTAARAAQPERTPEEVLADRPELRDLFVAGNKLGFCVIDIRPVVAFVFVPSYLSCAHDQGLSVGWADHYSAALDGQWIDVTGLPEAYYMLEAEVNPERLFAESDHSNNAAATAVFIWDDDGGLIGDG